MGEVRREDFGDNFRILICWLMDDGLALGDRLAFDGRPGLHNSYR